MYTLAKFSYVVEDTFENIYKIVNHSNVLIKEFHKETLWSTFAEDCPKDKTQKIITARISGTLKVKHSRRFKEANFLWMCKASDVLAIIK